MQLQYLFRLQINVEIQCNIYAIFVTEYLLKLQLIFQDTGNRHKYFVLDLPSVKYKASSFTYNIKVQFTLRTGASG